VHVLLISTYDLGRQPFGLASPAAWLRRAQNDVSCVDTSRSDLRDDQIRAADVIAFYLPMHTATRLAEALIARCRVVNPAAHLVAYGLYAPINAAWLRDRGVRDVLGPEAESDLVSITRFETLKPDDRLPRLTFIRPDRSLLPTLSEYAVLHTGTGEQKVVGSTEASRGCKHLCRHCPIVPVYDGAFRVVSVDVVLQDIAQQVGAGAQHISFGDPDFFNGPTHARRVVERLAADHPGVTYDVTIKIEHLLEYRSLLPVLKNTGCLFVTSAVESVDDQVLEWLAKGHTRTDFEEAVALCRSVGLTLTPTFVAFTPWTTVEGYLDLLRAIVRLELIEDVAPIQLAIRLLVTAGSRLMELADIRDLVGPFDAGSLTYPWRHRAPDVDALHREVMATVTAGAHSGRRAIFAAIWALAHARAGLEAPSLGPVSSREVAYLSEPWYCCAEPAEFHL
jgi:hypothetical protein